MRTSNLLGSSRLAFLCLLAGFAANAGAVTIQVNSNADGADTTPGDGTCGNPLFPASSCTLRAAIQEANANAAADNAITFSVAGPSTVLTALPNITKPLSINGGSGYTIDGGGIASLLRYTGGTAGSYTLSNLTLTRGTTSAAEGGGGIYFAQVGAATLSLTNVELDGNEATSGPGGGLAVELLVNGSALDLDDVTITGNTASGNGGGLWVRDGAAVTSAMSLDDAVVSGNTAGSGGNGSGGGIHVRRGRLNIGNATISGNTATGTGQGDGIFLERQDASSGGSIRMDNSTVSGNGLPLASGQGIGDGIAIGAGNPAASWITFSTIANQDTGIRAADPATSFPGNAQNPFTSNIVADHTTANCTVAFAHGDSTNSGYNLTDSAACGFTQATDQVVTPANLRLAGLASNPSAPQTHALLAGSPAIDAGNPTWSTGADQRDADAQDGGADGTPGDSAAKRDIGAYEYGGLGLVQFSLANFTVDEDNGPALVLIKRYGNGTAATSTPQVRYQTTADTATQGTCGTGANAANDYTAVDGPITANPMAFTFTATGPTQFEHVASMTICNELGEAADAATEKFNIALLDAAAGDAVGYDFGPNQNGTVTINDAENGTFQFNPLTYSSAEGNPGADGSVTLTITRTGGSKGAVRVSYSSSSTCTTACTATAGTDYTAVNTFVDFADGETSKTVPVSFIGDSAFENGAGETFEVTLSGAACQGLPAGRSCDARLNPTAANRTSRVTITNDDTAVAGTLRLESVTYTANEADGTLAVKVKRVGGSDGVVGVSYASTDGTATAGVAGDYFLDQINPRTLSWGNGVTADQTFTVTLVNDPGTIESNKDFVLRLLTPTGGATIDPAFDEAAVTLVSDEQPAFEFVDITFATAEGTSTDDGLGADLQLTWDAFEGGPVQIGYYTTDGTAVSPTDYTGIPQSTPTVLTINPADPTTRDIGIQTASDASPEANETFSVVLSAPTGGATLAAGNPALVTLIDPAGVRFTSASFTRANEQNAQTITATVERIGDASKALSVDFAISQNCLAAPCATEGTDYTRSGGFTGTLSWQGTDANNTEAPTRTFTITVIGDTLIEGDEGIRLTLSNAVQPGLGAAAIGGTNPATALIPDDDYRFEFVDVSPLAVAEGGGTAQVGVRRFGSTLGAASVGFATADGTALAGTDYAETKSPPALSWAAGEGGIKTITVPVVSDTLDEADETLTLALAAPSNNVTGQATAIPASPLTLSITDDDAVTVAFSTATQTVPESGNVTVTVTRTGDTTFALDVPFTVSGTAANPGDHAAANGSFTIPANQASATYTFAVVADTRDEQDETIVLTLGTPTGGTVSAGTPATHTVTITDNDAVTVAFSAATQSVAESVGNVVVTVTRTGTTDFAIDVPVQVSGTAGAADHNAVNGIVQIPANATSASASFMVTQDTLDETAETVVLTLGTPTGGTVTAAAPATQTVTIADDDAPPTLSIADVAVTEGDTTDVTATFTVTLSAPSGQGVTVSVATANGTAIAPDDFTAVPTTALTFAAGQTSRTVSVTVRSDAVDEATETFTAVLTNPVNATLFDGTGTGTILDAADDVAAPPADGGGGSFGLLGLGLLLPAWLRRRRAS